MYRKGVGIVLINANGEVFAGRRIDMALDVWQMPQGGVDYGEETLSAAYRELEEETSIKSHMVSVVAVSKDWLSYDFPDNLAKRVMGGKFIGQKQRWFAFKFNGSDSEIEVNTKNPEFASWCWMSPEKLSDQIVDFKKSIYGIVFEEFSEILLNIKMKGIEKLSI